MLVQEVELTQGDTEMEGRNLVDEHLLKGHGVTQYDLLSVLPYGNKKGPLATDSLPSLFKVGIDAYSVIQFTVISPLIFCLDLDGSLGCLLVSSSLIIRSGITLD